MTFDFKIKNGIEWLTTKYLFHRHSKWTWIQRMIMRTIHGMGRLFYGFIKPILWLGKRSWSCPSSGDGVFLCHLNILCYIKVITKLPNSEQSYKGKVKTHNYINRQNQSTTGKLWKRNDPDLVQAFLKNTKVYKKNLIIFIERLVRTN